MNETVGALAAVLLIGMLRDYLSWQSTNDHNTMVAGTLVEMRQTLGTVEDGMNQLSKTLVTDYEGRVNALEAKLKFETLPATAQLTAERPTTLETQLATAEAALATERGRIAMLEAQLQAKGTATLAPEQYGAVPALAGEESSSNPANKYLVRPGVYRNVPLASENVPLEINDENVAALENDIKARVHFQKLENGTYAQAEEHCRRLSTHEKTDELGDPRYTAVELCRHEQVHIAQMAGYTSDERGWVADPMPGSIGQGEMEWLFDAASPTTPNVSTQTFLEPGEHTSMQPTRGDKPPAGCEANGLNVKIEKPGGELSGAFCCATFPSAVNRSPCKPVFTHDGIYGRENVMFFGFLKFAQIFKRNKVNFVLVQGTLLGIARGGDINCHDHDMDIIYNLAKHHGQAALDDISVGVMNDVMQEVAQIPLYLAGSEDAEYGIEQVEGCLDPSRKGLNERSYMGTSRVRIQMEACRGTPDKKSYDGANDCTLMTPFAVGLDADEPDTIVWRGWRVPVPTQPLYYLEENPGSGPNWMEPSGTMMHAMIGEGGRSKFIQCVIDNGGTSKFEMNSMEPSARDALQAKIKEKCAGMGGGGG